MENQTSVSEFLLLEFSNTHQLQILHFLLFLVLYLATVTGNLLIIVAVAFDHHLHTPMYFFLMSLAIQDLGSVSAIMPKSMVNSLFNTRHISFSGCVAQFFFFMFFAGSDLSLLTVMAYDRYIAICYPLQYEMIMNRRACTQMLAGVWIFSVLNAVLHACGTFSTPFCSNVVDQFFCEIPKLLKLTCSDLNQIELGYIVFIVIIAFGCFIFTTVTYVYIFTAVLRIPSVKGRQKAFSTCLPHLTVFSIFIFTPCFSYLRPSSNTPSNLDLAFTMIYSIVPPLLNPVIYSMRNKDLKVALIKLLDLRLSSKNGSSTFLL
ncbi:olfactory receptor 14A16-like [Hemicordylus capensis]|uniref:olfactory receptor 14A16-like n=1 Tax=Hemicordylus capensis TaxID=884348 RepID=UPI002302C9C2|nr:olfactory receptor 14A16-like [Hemicordylus capensis]